MAIAPWYVLAAGKIRTDEEEKKRLESGEGGRTKYIGDWRRTEEQRKVCLELERITKEIGAKRITSGDTPLILFPRELDSDDVHSCYRIPYAQGPLRFPDHWWTQNRASLPKPRSSRNIAHGRTSQVAR